MSNKIFDKLIAKEGLNVDDNHLKLFRDIQFSMYPARAFALILQKLSNDKNPKYLIELGSVMGGRAAKEMYDEVKKLKMFLSKDYQKIGGVILLSGFGNVEVDKKGKNYVVTCKNNPVISQGAKIYKKKSNVCNFYGQVFTEFVKKFEKSKNLNFNHTKCISKGDKYCEWILKNGKTN